MKKLIKWLGFMMAAVAIVLGSSGAYALADDPAITDPIGDLDGGAGQGVAGANTLTQSQEIMEGQVKDYDYYVKQINKHIVEMKLESCPIDQILRASTKTQKSKSIVVKYYEIGQRPIKSTLEEAISQTSDGVAHSVKPVNNSVFDFMDTIIFPEILGYDEAGNRETLKPLMVRVVGQDQYQYPLVIAVNGVKNANKGNRWDLPAIPAGATMLRLGRAAGEKDVETASYYELPEPSEQYCQRFIMQAEESIIERMSAKALDWDFSKQERIAMDDMRDGMERSGLFGIKSLTRYGKNGNVYTTGGIYWLAGKDIELGSWIPKTVLGSDGKEHVVTASVQDKDDDGHLLYTCTVSGTDTVVYTTDGGTTWKNTSGTTVTPDATPVAKMTDKTVYEYVITEEQLHEFVRQAIQDAGNGSRTKLLFVDNLIYKALSNLKSKRRIIMQTESNYQGWGIDFESFSSMGTKIMIYRHDAFNYMGMSGCAFMLDPRYLEKWIFGNWQRQEYDLKKLFIRNSNAVVMEEFSCWTLYFPNAHARVFRPEFDPDLGVTDELQAA
jgi:hypothetical protein